MMITEGLDTAVSTLLDSVLYAGEYEHRSAEQDVILVAKNREMIALIRAEAINLADFIIGKDKLLHGDQKQLDPVDKSIFDFQVAQRVKLSEYQNPAPKGKPTGPEDLLNPELSENEG